MKIGTAYYPDYFPASDWPADLDRMKAAGIECVRILEFAWSWYQPEPDRWSWDGLDTFLDHAALVSDQDGYEEEAAPVTLMTIHASKGLEFPLVFVIGCEENILPHFRALDSDDDLEEERRLCYVAITRAQRYLYLTEVRERRMYGNFVMSESSRFIQEIPESLINDTQLRPAA